MFELVNHLLDNKEYQQAYDVLMEFLSNSSNNNNNNNINNNTNNNNKVQTNSNNNNHNNYTVRRCHGLAGNISYCQVINSDSKIMTKLLLV